MPEASLQAACEARLGQTLRGKWTLERIIGVGGMAAVYAGVHKIGRKDAIKILHPEVARSKEQSVRFEQEAHAANKLSHPGAVEIRDIDVSEDGCPFLVMELLEGENLAERASRLGGLPTDELLRYVDDLLDVLTAAHAQGIVHRDIKLDNLFVTTEGKLKVLDFGIARVKTGPAVTRLGARLGTTAYMAPEQVVGGEVDGRADVFAVGATMFRVLAKRRVHEAKTEADLLVKMGRDPAPKLATVLLGVDPDLALVVDRALEFRRDDRYPNAATMQADVRALRSREPPAFARGRASATAPMPAAAVAVARATAAPLSGEPTAAAAPAPMRRSASTDRMAVPVGLQGGTTAPLSQPPTRAAHTVAIATPAPPAPSATPTAPPSMRTPPPGLLQTKAGTPTPPPGSLTIPVQQPSALAAAVARTPQGFATPVAQPAHLSPHPPRPRSSPWPIVAAVAVLALAVVGGGALFLTSTPSRSAAVGDVEDEETDEESAPKKKAKDEKSRATASMAAKPATAAASAGSRASARPTAEPRDQRPPSTWSPGPAPTELKVPSAVVTSLPRPGSSTGRTLSPNL
jgi:serine/threonine-protein kinase